MKITKQEDNYLLKNDKGEYHLSIEKYEELGEAKAIEFAKQEIDKKLGAKYHDVDIDFERARSLGFCEYGIEDFCKKLDLDINKKYKISYLRQKLSKEVFLSYSDECLKLFGKGVFDIFGGAKEFLSNNRTRQCLNIVLNNAVSERDMHKLSCVFAFKCLENYEKEFPNDNRVKRAIEAKLGWIEGNVTEDELSAAESAARSAAWSAESARSAARSAAWSAAWSAARSARSAESAARSAAWSARSAAWSARSAAWSAESARSAARSAAWSAALENQIEEVLKFLV